MDVSQEIRDRVFNWMRAELRDFHNTLDLAVCCTADLELWEGDYEIPQWIVELAEAFIPDVTAQPA